MEKAPGIDGSGRLGFEDRRAIIGEAFKGISADPDQALIDTGELELELLQADEFKVDRKGEK